MVRNEDVEDLKAMKVKVIQLGTRLFLKAFPISFPIILPCLSSHVERKICKLECSVNYNCSPLLGRGRGRENRV